MTMRVSTLWSKCFQMTHCEEINPQHWLLTMTTFLLAVSHIENKKRHNRKAGKIDLTLIISIYFNWPFTAFSYSDLYHLQNSNYYPLQNSFRTQSWNRLSRKIPNSIFTDAQATEAAVISELQSLHPYNTPTQKLF